MFIRWVTYIVVGLVLVLFNLVANTRFGWSIDIAWVLVAAAAFAWPVEIALIAAFVFGLTIDGLSGSSGFYTVSYMAMAIFMMLARRIFYLNGFITAWIVAVLGSEILWLFMWIFARGVQMIGGGARPQGFISPSILSTFLLFPIFYAITGLVLFKPVERPISRQFGSAKRTINRT